MANNDNAEMSKAAKALIQGEATLKQLKGVTNDELEIV